MVENSYYCSCDNDNGEHCSNCRCRATNRRIINIIGEYKAPAEAMTSKFVENIGNGLERLGTTKQRTALVQKYHMMEKTLEYLLQNVETHEDTIQEALVFDPLNI